MDRQRRFVRRPTQFVTDLKARATHYMHEMYVGMARRLLEACLPKCRSWTRKRWKRRRPLTGFVFWCKTSRYSAVLDIRIREWNDVANAMWMRKGERAVQSWLHTLKILSLRPLCDDFPQQSFGCRGGVVICKEEGLWSSRVHARVYVSVIGLQVCILPRF